MLQQILVPVDGSELAERALPCAARLARASGATLHLVQVVGSPPPAWGATLGLYLPDSAYDDVVAAETRAAAAYLDGLRTRLEADGLSVRATHLVGDVASLLLDYEREAGIDLVVLCSHGRGGLARFTLGSIAARLLHHGAVPVLLVRAFGAPVDLTQAVMPLDGSRLAEEALPVVAALAGPIVQGVTLLRVAGSDEDGVEAERYLNGLAERLRREVAALRGDGACRVQVTEGDPAQVILETAGADRLVVMATHGRSGLTRWPVGSVTDRVARGGAAGVLAVRAGAASAAQGPA